MKIKKKLAIIGVGPRGSMAFENLVIEFCSQNALKNCSISLYEKSNHPGSGPIYRANQPDANWMNVSHRFLELGAREKIESNELGITVEAFPTYHEWITKKNITIDDNIDVYPRRSFVGNYLQERFQSLFRPLQVKGIVDLKKDLVQKISLCDGQVEILAKEGTSYMYDEVLLTIGHQSTKIDEQMQSWKNFITENKLEENLHLFTNPYPLSQYLECDYINENTTIAVRGFGLSTIDIIRAVSEKIGKLEIVDDTTRATKFICSGKYKNLFAPFTLEGLPPIPKPLNKIIDNQFSPRPEHLESLKNQLSDKSIQRKARGAVFLTQAMVPIIAEMYLNLENNNNLNCLSKQEIEEVLTNFLKDEKFTHQVLTNNVSVLNLMKEYVQMSLGETAVSLDYCLGQIWRHCQETIYRSLSHNELSAEVFKEIIALDERLKRYSYGPPVESIQMLIALAEKKILNLVFLDNPNINICASGWKLRVSDKEITAQLMINSVLDAPKILETETAIIKNLLEDNLVQAAHEDLGVLTNEYAYIFSQKNNSTLPVALLGRLAKGSVIGVDAILECFGPRSKNWAKQAVLNLLRNK